MNYTGRPTFHKPIKRIQVTKDKIFNYVLNNKGFLEKDDNKNIKCTISEMPVSSQQNIPCQNAIQNNNGFNLLPDNNSSLIMSAQEEFPEYDNGFDSNHFEIVNDNDNSFFTSYDNTTTDNTSKSTFICDNFDCLVEGLFDNQYDNDFPY